MKYFISSLHLLLMLWAWIGNAPQCVAQSPEEMLRRPNKRQRSRVEAVAKPYSRYVPPPFRVPQQPAAADTTAAKSRSIDTPRDISAPRDIEAAAKPAQQAAAARPTKIVPKPLQIGASLTANAYIGDYTQRGYAFTRFHSGGNLSMQLETDKRIQPQFNTGFGKIAGEYDNRVPPLNTTEKLPNGFQRITFFQTSFFYGDIRLRYRFLRIYPDYIPVWEPYVSAGAGFLIFSPRDKVGKFLSESAKTRPVGERYPTFVAQFPLSVGVKYRVNKQLAIGTEYTYRLTPSDYLDNLGRLGSKRGNDQLHTLSATVFINIQAPTIYIDTCGIDENWQWWEISPVLSIQAELDTASAQEEILPQLLSPDSALSVRTLRLRMGYYEPVVAIDSRAQMLRRAFTLRLPPLKRMPVPPIDKLIGKIEDDNYRAEITQQALDNGDVMYYHAKPSESLEELAHRYWVTPDIIRELNGLSPTALHPPAGKYLTLPDLRKYYKK